MACKEKGESKKHERMEKSKGGEKEMACKPKTPKGKPTPKK